MTDMTDFVNRVLTGEQAVLWRQLDQLFKPINPDRIKTLKGQSYLESWDVAAHLTRIFGPLNWDTHVVESSLAFEDQRETGKWDVAYRATVRLTVRTTLGAVVHEDVAVGSAENQPNRATAHDNAYKTAVSDAMKRAARLLGNQFGLSLYNKGNTSSVVGFSLAHPNPFPEEEK